MLLHRSTAIVQHVVWQSLSNLFVHAMRANALPLALAGLVLLLLSGCTMLDDPSATGLRNEDDAGRKPFTRSTLRNQTIPPAVSFQNRLLIVGTDGNLYTSDPDGGNRVAVTTDASSTRSYLQPTWSPTGEKIAWSRVDAEEGATLTIGQFDGTIESEIDVPFPPFYIFWSPQGERLAYLSNWRANSMALRMVELDGNQAQAETLAQGQPFYFSWAPDGEQLLTHVGNQRTAIRQLDGAERPLSAASIGFPAPQWTPDGEKLIFATGDNELQTLVLTDVEGEPIREITLYDGSITFTQSPSMDEIAYVVTESDSGFPTFGPLYLVETETGRTQEISGGPVIAFFWSPDGTKLAFIRVEPVGDSFWLRWSVWNGKQVTEYARFLPSRTFLQSYLTFFDQYAQSTSLWAPDSSAFAYAGVSPSRRNGIWVQDLAQERPDRVGSGVFVVWSPQ